MRARLNILVAEGTRTAKTTLSRILPGVPQWALKRDLIPGFNKRPTIGMCATAVRPARGC